MHEFVPVFPLDCGERQREHRAVRAELLVPARGVVPALLPVVHDGGHAGSGAFADLDVREDFQHVLVARVGLATHESALHADTEVAGVGDRDLVGLPEHDNALALVVVGVREAVRQGLAQGLVGRCVVVPPVADEPEGRLERLFGEAVNALVEVDDVARPIASLGDDAVLPTLARARLLTVVEEVVREHLADAPVLAEHEEPGPCGVELPVVGLGGGTDEAEELVVGLLVPRVVWVDLPVDLAVAVYRLLTELVHAHAR